MNTAALPSILPGLDVDQVTFAGDFHGQAKWSRHVLGAARRAGSQAVVQLGDFGLWSGTAGERYLDEVNAHAARLEMPVLWIDGNHEDFDLLETFPLGPDGLRVIRPWVTHVPRGHRWTWHGLRFAALGGATSLDRPARTPHVTWWPGEEISWADAQRTIDGGEADVMLTHDCPQGVTIPGLPAAASWSAVELHRAQAHRHLLRQVVDEVRPTHLLHGHFHVRHDAELVLDDGLSVAVTGLDRDGTMARAYTHVNLDDLFLDSVLRRHAAHPGA